MENYVDISFIIAGAIVILGFLGSLLFDRFRVPDILFLVLTGVIIGPLTHLIDPSQLETPTKYFGQLVLVFILFEGGLQLDFLQVVRNIRSGMTFGIFVFACTVAGCWAVSVYVLPAFLGYQVSHEGGLLIGAILGGTSSVIVMPLLQRLKVGESTKMTLSLESIATDIFVVLAVIVIIDVLRLGGVQPTEVLNKLLGSFSIAVVIGLLFGLTWIAAMRRVQQTPFSYMTTIATAIMVYAFVNLAKGSGAIAVFTFSVVLNNADRFLALFGVNEPFMLEKKIGVFQKEISLLLRTYFFVLIGLHCTGDKFTTENLTVGGIMLAVCVIARWLATTVYCGINSRERPAKTVYLIMMPRGLAAAIMSTFPYMMLKQSGAASGDFPDLLRFTQNFVAYTIIAIVATNVLTFLLVKGAEKRLAAQFVDSAAASSAPGSPAAEPAPPVPPNAAAERTPQAQ